MPPGQEQRLGAMKAGETLVSPREHPPSGFLDAYQGEPTDAAEAAADDPSEVVTAHDPTAESSLQVADQFGVAVLPQGAPADLEQADRTVDGAETALGRPSDASASNQQMIDGNPVAEIDAAQAATAPSKRLSGVLDPERRYVLGPDPDISPAASDFHDNPDGLADPRRDGALPTEGFQQGANSRAPVASPAPASNAVPNFEPRDIPAKSAEDLPRQEFALDPGSDVQVFIPGPPPDAVRASVAAPAVPEPIQVARQISQQLDSAKDSNIEIVLSPEELGKVRISIGHGDIPSISISADRPETLDLLRRHVDILSGEMRAAGLSGAEISFGNGSDAAGGNDISQARKNRPAKIHGPERELLDAVAQATAGFVSGRQLDIRI